jgi:hypothetical protein
MSTGTVPAPEEQPRKKPPQSVEVEEDGRFVNLHRPSPLEAELDEKEERFLPPEPKAPPDDPAELKQQIAKLKNRIWRLWSRNHRQRYMLGKWLKALKAARGSGGHDAYCADLAELDITYPTARRLIIYHVQTRTKFGNNLDWKPIRFQNENDGKWLEIEDIHALERAMEEGVADKEIAEREELIAAEAAKIEKARATKAARTPTYRLVLTLRSKQRDRLHKKWRGLKDPARSQLIYKAVMNDRGKA